MGTKRARDTVHRLQADITSGRWPVNGRIPTEFELAAEYSVGRSTIREAVRSLAHLGMLEPAPGRGAFVRSLHPVRGLLSDFAATHTAADILEVRAALEGQAARLAAARARPEDLVRLRSAHEADLAGDDLAERGSTPGQFHALLVEASGNLLLIELYAALMAAIRGGLKRHEIELCQGSHDRQLDHRALLSAIEAGEVVAAGAIAETHAKRDLVETGHDDVGPAALESR